MLDCIWLISATQMLADIDSIDQIPIIADSPIGVSLCNFWTSWNACLHIEYDDIIWVSILRSAQTQVSVM